MFTRTNFYAILLLCVMTLTSCSSYYFVEKEDFLQQIKTPENEIVFHDIDEEVFQLYLPNGTVVYEAKKKYPPEIIDYIETKRAGSMYNFSSIVAENENGEKVTLNQKPDKSFLVLNKDEFNEIKVYLNPTFLVDDYIFGYKSLILKVWDGMYIQNINSITIEIERP